MSKLFEVDYIELGYKSHYSGDLENVMISCENLLKDIEVFGKQSKLYD